MSGLVRALFFIKRLPSSDVEADADFIAHTPEDIAALLADVERLERQLAEIKEDGCVESQRRQLAEAKLTEAERQRETE